MSMGASWRTPRCVSTGLPGDHPMARNSRHAVRARRVRRRRGAALLEVLIGLTVLAIAGVALLALLAQVTDGAHRQHLRDVETGAASARLEAVALWTREQLDARMGSSPLADWTL